MKMHFYGRLEVLHKSVSRSTHDSNVSYAIPYSAFMVIVANSFLNLLLSTKI